LIVVAADRPQKIRTSGANQIANHLGIFGDSVRESWDLAPADDSETASTNGKRVAQDAVNVSLGKRGPVLVNAQFSEPLSSPIEQASIDPITPGELPKITSNQSTTMVEAGPGTLVVAGFGAGSRAEEWARQLGAPLFAEVHSGARFGPHLVANYQDLLDDPELIEAIDTVVVVGRPTLTSKIDSLCNRGNVKLVVVRGNEFYPYRPNPTAMVVDTITVTGNGDMFAPGWGIPIARKSRMALDAAYSEPAAGTLGSMATNHAERADFARSEADIQREQVTPEMLVRAVWDSTWPHDRLVFGASSMIRIANGVVPGKPLVVHTNRGLSGIDGTIATAQGVAHASQPIELALVSGVTRVVLGDLAAAYDATSLGLIKGRIQIIVANNQGGKIFDELPVRETADPEHFERVMRTPQSVAFEQLALAYGVDYALVKTRGELTEALTRTAAPILIEVLLPS
jgi:2-succinyl-5-enolpyruvyl-6-hydroxy-3-cyclohexene-1-carboxylate synthase